MSKRARATPCLDLACLPVAWLHRTSHILEPKHTHTQKHTPRTSFVGKEIKAVCVTKTNRTPSKGVSKLKGGGENSRLQSVPCIRATNISSVSRGPEAPAVDPPSPSADWCR
eukprot:7888534-Pyramimonas_sp.AAC.2